MTSTGNVPEVQHRARTEEQTEAAFCNRAQEWQQDWQAPGPAGPYWQAPCVWGGCRALCGYSSWESQQPIIRLSGLLSVSFLLPTLNICWLSLVLLWKVRQQNCALVTTARKAKFTCIFLTGMMPTCPMNPSGIWQSSLLATCTQRVPSS